MKRDTEIKYLLCLFALAIYTALIYLMPPSVGAADTEKTFQWEQVISDDFAGWNLYYGTAQGGPYDVGNEFIQYEGIEETTYQSSQIIIAPNGEETTYYFVLTAVDSNGNESEHSNEVVVVFDFAPPSAPLTFRLVIEVEAQ